MSRFSKRTEDLLQGAGWYPGRSVDIGEIAADLQAGGYLVTVRVKDFLREFGNLAIHDEKSNLLLSTVFSALDAGEPEVGPIREYLNLQLCPVANAIPSCWVLIEESGNIYETDAYTGFDLIGYSVDEALENILHLRTISRVLGMEELRKIVPPYD
jgi:hypothetical protein